MWQNLRRDILHLFEEAQSFAVERVRFIHFQRAVHRKEIRRPAYNRRQGGGSFYAKQRARYTNYVIPVLIPDGSLVCDLCGYVAHTKTQLGSHRFCCERRSRQK